MGLAGMDTPHEASPFEPYLRAWEARWQEERQAAVRAAEEARALAGRLAWLLVEKYGARRVVLVGSLARGEFGAGSDIDLAAEGIPDDSFFRAGADLEAAAGGLHVDLVPLESATPAFLADQARDGIVLHGERRR
jgi:predicted nucleotidyltransferase